MCKGVGAHNDLYQLAAVCTSLGAVVVQIVYLSVVGIESRQFISERLVSDVWYRFSLSGFVVGTLVLCILYFWRHRGGNLKAASLGGGFAGGAIKSWVALVALREDLYPTLHGIATLAFVINAGICTCFQLALDLNEHELKTNRYRSWHISIVVTLILSSTYFFLFYSQSSIAWLVEQLAFTSFNVSQLFFFVYHPFKRKETYTPVTNQYTTELYSMAR